jgi:hypothetical protein
VARDSSILVSFFFSSYTSGTSFFLLLAAFLVFVYRSVRFVAVLS